MTEQDKQLLLADLCARLPYGVIVELDEKFGFNKGTRPLVKELLDLYCVEGIKPYLRPMSSMTEDEKKEYAKLLFADLGGVCEDYYKALDYLHKKHINYRLPPHLFIEITEENNPYE